MSTDRKLRRLLSDLGATRSKVRAGELIAEVERHLSGEPVERWCEWCGEKLTSTHPETRYCSTKCRVAAHRARAVT
jgi:hypothetical protein